MTTRIQTADAFAPALVHPSRVSRAIHALVATHGGIASTVLRLTLGLVMLPHGAQKLLGWFGGQGFSGTVAGLTQHAGLPVPIAVLVILIEFFGSLALILGVFSRAAALGVIAVMVGCHREGPPAQRLLHELERRSGWRGLRVSPARHRHRAGGGRRGQRTLLDRPRALAACSLDASLVSPRC